MGGNGDDLLGRDEDLPDPRPVFPLVEPDRFYDEPAVSGKGVLLMRYVCWCAQANKVQRCGLLALTRWICEAPDGERRAVLTIFERFEGRVPLGAVDEIAALVGVSRETVRKALIRFEKFVPGAVSKQRRTMQ